VKRRAVIRPIIEPRVNTAMREVNKVICLFKMTAEDGRNLLLNYISPDWGIPLFVNVPLPAERGDDAQFIREYVSSQLQIPLHSISLQFDRDNEAMRTSTVKRTGDRNKALQFGEMTKYNFYYCILKVATPPRHLRRQSFTLDGLQYQWLNLNELKSTSEVRDYNYDVLGFLSDRFESSLVGLENSFPDLMFVITAFTPDMEDIFEGIKAAGEACGFEVRRVKDIEGDYRITDKIVEMIEDARVVVADLSHERPNVYFELGYARGVGKKVATVARQGTTLHFDVKDWTCIFYGDSRELQRRLSSRLKSDFRSANAEHPVVGV
jgi:hypothetical protein